MPLPFGQLRQNAQPQAFDTLQGLPGGNSERSFAEIQAEQAKMLDLLGMADGLMESGYIPNSGWLGVVEQGVRGYKAGKDRKKAEKGISDLMREESELLTKKEREKLEAEAAKERRKIDAMAKALNIPREKAEGMVVAGLKPSDVIPKEAKKPGAIAEFEGYLQLPPDQRAAFDAYREKGKSGGTSVNVSLPPQIGAFQRAMGTKDAELYASARDKATSSQQALNSVDSLEAILSNTKTGKMEEVVGQLAQWAGSEAGADYQATNALVNERVFELINALKGPATDKDAERAMAQIPNMGTDPRARAVVFDYLRKKAGADIQMFDQMDKFATEKGGLQGFKPSVGAFTVDASPLGGASGSGGYLKGQIINIGGKQYRVIAGGDDPEVEEI